MIIFFMIMCILELLFVSDLGIGFWYYGVVVGWMYSICNGMFFVILWNGIKCSLFLVEWVWNMFFMCDYLLRGYLLECFIYIILILFWVFIRI